MTNKSMIDYEAELGKTLEEIRTLEATMTTKADKEKHKKLNRKIESLNTDIMLARNVEEKSNKEKWIAQIEKEQKRNSESYNAMLTIAGKELLPVLEKLATVLSKFSEEYNVVAQSSQIISAEEISFRKRYQEDLPKTNSKYPMLRIVTPRLFACKICSSYH